MSGSTRFGARPHTSADSADDQQGAVIEPAAGEETPESTLNAGRALGEVVNLGLGVHTPHIAGGVATPQAPRSRSAESAVFVFWAD